MRCVCLPSEKISHPNRLAEFHEVLHKHSHRGICYMTKNVLLQTIDLKRYYLHEHQPLQSQKCWRP